MQKMRLGLAVFGFLMVIAPTASAVDIRTGTCLPLEVSEVENRLHVQCQASIAGTNIRYFAESTANRERANRLLSMFLVAQSLGAQLFFRFDLDDTSAESFGCLASDCRRPTWVMVQSPPQTAAPTLSGALLASRVVLVPEPTRRYSTLAGLCTVAGLAAVGRNPA